MNRDGTTQDISAEPVPQHRYRRGPRGYVYFIRAGDRIKIGFSREPERRLRDLQIAHGEPLELLKVVPGSIETESRLHAEFRKFRSIGEWFHASPELLAYIGIATGKVEQVNPSRPDRRPVPREAHSLLSSILRRRREVGAESQEGHLLTNLAEQVRWLEDEDPRPWATHPMQTVKGLMAWQTKNLETA